MRYLRNNYNDITKFYIMRFVDEFLFLFPKFLTREELISRIESSLKHNITFKKLNNDIVGIFIPKDGVIVCNELLDEKKLDSVLFHEFLHAITSKYQMNNCDYHLSYVYDGEKFLESIVSLMELKFYNSKYGESKERVTEYIPDYAEQLEKVFGNDFLKTFVRNYTDVSCLFNKKSNSFVNYALKKICYNVNELHDCINYSNNPEKIDYINFCLEKDIALVLRECLINSNLSEEEKLSKINSLYLLQQSPNLDIYIDMINSCCKNKNLLSKYSNLEIVYNLYNGVSYGSVQLKDKISKFLAMKVFGFNELVDDKRYEESSIKPFFENQIFYTSLINAIYQRDLDVGNISSNSFTKLNVAKNLSSMVLSDRLKYGKNICTCYDRFSCFSRLDMDNKTCYIENCDGNVRVYKPCDIIYLVTIFLSGGHFNIVKSLLNLSSDGIYTIYYPITLNGELNFFDDYLDKTKLIYEKDGRIMLEEYENDTEKRSNISYFMQNNFNMLNSMILPKYSVKRR